jgi:hypothetical protein
MMTALHIDIAYHLDQDCRGKLIARVTGLDAPDEATEIALRETGGSWSNKVTWYEGRKAYFVVGMYDNDPNWGDHPANLDRRLRLIHGDWDVSIRITHPDGIVYNEGTLRSEEVNQALLASGSLN